jgi:hypothetical protein
LKTVSQDSEENKEEQKKETPSVSLKQIQKIDKNVEKALDDFFLNDDGDFDQIDPTEAQGAIKFKEIKRSTPKPPQKKPVKIEETKIELKGQEQILNQFIAEIKTSQETKLLSEPHIVANVLEATYCPGGIFQFAYNEYTIVTNPFGWMTKRRENDFVKLREYLCKSFPQYCIPPLVTPRSMYDNSSLKEKEIFFQKFLNDILSNEELRACMYLQLFLTTPNEKEYKPIRKKYEKYSMRPVELNDYSTIDGKVSINVSSNNEELLKNYNTMFVTRFQSVFKELEDSTDEIERNSIALNKSITKFSQCFEKLSEIYSEVGYDEFSDMYSHIRDLTQLYGDGIVEQAKNIKSHLNHDFKYHFFEADSYKEVSKLKSDVEYTYKKWSNDLKFKKDKLWNYKDYKDYSKWNLAEEDMFKIDELIENEALAKLKMLPRETEFVINKLHLLRYVENQ